MSSSGSLASCKLVHCCTIKSGFESDIAVSCSLINAYSRSGHVRLSQQVFKKLPSINVICFTSIINGYAQNGMGRECLEMLNAMIQRGLKPDEVTFLSVLTGCNHSGLVEEGRTVFDSMKSFHGIDPDRRHYSCLVDLLGRAGRLEEAYNLIRTIPFELNHAVWGALLGACVIHENVELGELAAKQLFKLEPENTGNYVLMAKIYAAAGRWKDAENTRRMIDGIGLRKTPAHSLIEVRNM